MPSHETGKSLHNYILSQFFVAYTTQVICPSDVLFFASEGMLQPLEYCSQKWVSLGLALLQKMRAKDLKHFIMEEVLWLTIKKKEVFCPKHLLSVFLGTTFQGINDLAFQTNYG